MDARKRLSLLALGVLALAGCKGKGSPEGIVSLSAPAEQVAADPATVPKEGGPRIGAVEMAAPVYLKPDRRSPKIGYLRAGATAVRGEKPAAFDDCQGGYYRVLPAGYICAEGSASIDMKHPILRALTRRPDLSKPMPYPYAFVRAIAPNYYRPASKAEQFQYEMRLKEHLRSYKRLQKKWDAIEVGANDVPLDAEGNAIGEPPTEAPDLPDQELYGGDGNDAIPGFSRAAARSRTSRRSRSPTTRSSRTASHGTRASRSSARSSATTTGASR
ncbi:hypothetical protein [Polyangium mundeleinium]|uniref:Lipoprotein n=1 Tax=Polyangium mundeleinium TaxID=2995306 RepID=A0ABT5F4D3_9BACT|nr:hypothetical protein [Polyangium mundeleinium]MDC0748263.1 hypothetical protein [Polyangium mundeleinium]